MCLYFSNAFFVGLYSLFVGPIFVIIVGGIMFGEWDYVHLFQGIYSMLIIKLLYFHGLRKIFFPFRINIVELNYIQGRTPLFRIKKNNVKRR